ncbi:MAG: hypothetical protein L0Y56_02730 [Nitrospira sp.]|nr:hypothetical protein [Nitrospira sp.]
MRNGSLPHLYRPAVPDEYGPQAREMLRQLLDRVNFLLERMGEGAQPGETVTTQRPAPSSTLPSRLRVSIQAAQDAQTQAPTFVGFGTTQPTSMSVSISGGGVGYAFTETSPGVITMTVASASTARGAIGAAASGANTDITSLTGLTGAVQAASGSAIDFGRVVVAMAADADQTLSGGQFNKLIIEMSGGTTLTATRNIILPTLDGRIWIVENTTTGGQSLVFKTSGGAGVTVANGNRAIVYCDGTDIVLAAN